MVNQYKVLDIIGHVSEMFRRESLVMSSEHNHVVMIAIQLVIICFRAPMALSGKLLTMMKCL